MRSRNGSRWLASLALGAGVALLFGLAHAHAGDGDEPKDDAKPTPAPSKSSATGDGKPSDDGEDDDDKEPAESPNLKLPAGASSALVKAVEAFKAAYKRLYKEGYIKAKDDLYAAAKLLKRAREEEMGSPLPLYYLGILNQIEKDDKRAIENLAPVVKMAPKFYEAWTELGDAHSHLGQTKEAESCYAKALEIKPDHAPAFGGRASERLADGRYKDAIADAKAGLKLPAELAIKGWLLRTQMRAQAALDGPDWKQTFTKESEHYIMKTDVDQPYADWIAGQAELIRKLYVKVFEKLHFELPKKKYPVFVHASRQEYMKNGGPENAGGHFDPELRQLFLFRYDNNEDAQIVMFHEAFHQFLQPYLPVAPQWFNEGVADYFGGAKFKNGSIDGVQIKPNPWRVDTIKRGVATGKVTPLKVLLNMSQAEMYDKKTVGMNYAEAWSFIYFLGQSDQGKYFPLLGKYFSSLRAGKDQGEAYKAAFGDQNMDKIDEEWRAFVNKM